LAFCAVVVWLFLFQILTLSLSSGAAAWLSALLSFPTRRSSELETCAVFRVGLGRQRHGTGFARARTRGARRTVQCRQVIRACKRSEEHTSELSHVKISYAVLCLKKKNILAGITNC